MFSKSQIVPNLFFRLWKKIVSLIIEQSNRKVNKKKKLSAHLKTKPRFKIVNYLVLLIFVSVLMAYDVFHCQPVVWRGHSLHQRTMPFSPSSNSTFLVTWTSSLCDSGNVSAVMSEYNTTTTTLSGYREGKNT